MRRAFIAAALFIAATLCAVFSGCGQKGPLFIPDDNPAPNSIVPSHSQSFFY